MKYFSFSDLFFCIHSTFRNNVHKESTTLGVAFLPVCFEGHIIFDGGVGAAVQVSISCSYMS